MEVQNVPPGRKSGSGDLSGVRAADILLLHSPGFPIRGVTQEHLRGC